MKNLNLVPRFIRLRDAPTYLGMGYDCFCEKVRPYVTEIKDGPKIVLFDKVDLDAFADHYKAHNGRLGQRKEETPCHSGSKNVKTPTTSKSRALSSAKLLEKVLERI